MSSGYALKRGLPALLTCIALAGCAGNPQSRAPTQPYVPPPIKVIDTDRVNLKALSEDLPDPPGNGKAFIGLKVKDCLNLGKTGAYVIGFFFQNGKSPARDSGLLTGDRITMVNDNRISVNASDLSLFLSRVAAGNYYKFKVERQGISHSFEIKSILRPNGSPPLTKTSATTCLDIGLIDI